MPPGPDTISVKFADLQELEDAITKAESSLAQTRSDYMAFQNGTMTTAWEDDAGFVSLMRNGNFSQYGEDNETFLRGLRGAVEEAKRLLQDAVQRSKAGMGG
jgi:hypothetical protein